LFPHTLFGDDNIKGQVHIMGFNIPPHGLMVVYNMRTWVPNWWSYYLVRGCPHNSSFFSERRSHLIGPSPIFLEHWALPNLEA
jgi:hypothetical protein